MKNLIDKITEFLSSLDDKHKYYAFAGVLLLFFFMDYCLLMNPQLSALSKLSPEVNLLRLDITKVRNDIKQIDQYKANKDETQKKMDELGQRVLTREELPIVLEYISVLASDNKFQVDQMVPNPEEQRSLLINNGREYFTLPIEIRGRCSYHDFGRFLNKMENGEFDLRLGEFSILSSKSPSAPSEHAIHMKVLAVVTGNR